jgi:hypothetical protein
VKLSSVFQITKLANFPISIVPTISSIVNNLAGEADNFFDKNGILKFLSFACVQIILRPNCNELIPPHA